jgi:hypothetical protein
MVKRKITETVKEYDENGRVTKETVTETTEDDDTQFVPYYPTYPTIPPTPLPTWPGDGIRWCGVSCNARQGEGGCAEQSQI